MLTPDYLEHCADEAIKINAELENFIIKDIARRIVQSGVMTETARHQIKAVQESGYLYNDIIEEIANITNLSTKEVKKIFENAAIETMSFDDEIYELAGLKPTAFRESPAMMQILKTGIQKANNDINNLIMTTAGDAQSKFQEITNMAYRQYTSGAFDYNTAIFNAVEQLSKDGINVMYPSGKLDKIDVAVRRAVLTGVSQTANKLQDKRAEEMNCDLVEVTAHVGARVTKKFDHTNHAWWQGKVYSISGSNGKYPSLKEVTGYGKVDGLGGINCRHNKFPFIEGISKRAYTDKELEEINNKTVTYNGKEYGEYEALKMQREKEREIREIKREISGYQGIMLGSTDEQLLEEARNKFNLSSNKLKNKEKELNSFIKQTGLKRDMARERVAGFNKSISQKAVNGSKIIEKDKEILYNSSIGLGRKLGFVDNLGVNTFIPKDAEIKNILTIAGDNTKKFRSADKYAEKYGGKAEDWIKRAGKIESDKYIFDIHWVQGKNGLLCDWKIKNKTLKEGK